MFNVLEGRVIRFKRVDGSVNEGSLPEVYAALMRDGVLAFPALRPHQRHAWHAFIVQLGAMGMHRAGLSEPPKDATEWQSIIHALTPDFPDDEPWQLVVDDITKPAFMQPPASSEDRIADYRNTVATPDELDMLVTSKNHDLKASVAWLAEMDDWIFALITLQTMEGYSGSRNYGVSRMPSGYGNRPAFSITPTILPGKHARRDIVASLECREKLMDDYDLFLIDGGSALVWSRPWDGTKPEQLSGGLDPFYIEICRRIRLQWSSRRVIAVRANSLDRRIVDVKGDTGDPWAPANTAARGTPPAFLGPRKFGYARVVDGLVSPDWKRPYLLRLRDQDLPGEMQLVARGMVRGEGGTAGYHERIVPLKEKVLRAFGGAGDIEELGDISRDRIDDVRKVQRFLRHAVSVFAAGGATDGIGDEHRERANAWANRHDEIIDRDFFNDLQDEFERDDADERRQVRNEWRLRVIGDARDLLHQAEDALPCPSIQRYHARVRADSVFEGRIRSSNGFPELYPREEETGDQHNDV